MTKFGTASLSIEEMNERLDQRNRRRDAEPRAGSASRRRQAGVHLVEERLGRQLSVQWPEGDVRLHAGVVRIVDRSLTYDLEIAIGIDEDRGRAVADAVRILRRPGGPPVEAALVQKESLGHWVREAIRKLARTSDGGPLPTRAPSLLAAGARGRDKLALVAKAYSKASPGGRTEAVRQATGAASPGAARQLVKRARAAGLID